MDEFKWEEIYQSAYTDFNNNDFEVAFEKLESILAENPTFGKAFNLYGFFYETKIRDFKKAEEFYELAIKYSPNFTPTYSNFFILLSNLRKFDRLEELLQQAANVNGFDMANINYEYGLMYEQQLNLEKAIEHYRKAAQLTLDNIKLEGAINAIQRCKKKLSIP